MSESPKPDAVDDILSQWSLERPELDTAGLGVVIRIMSLQKKLARQAAAALGEVDLELWEYDVLSALRRQGGSFELPATTIARETELSAGAMTHRIDRLEQRGFVRRRHSAADRRQVIVALTAQGKRKVDEAIGHRLEVANDSLHGMGKRDTRSLARLLKTIAGNLESVAKIA